MARVSERTLAELELFLEELAEATLGALNRIGSVANIGSVGDFPHLDDSVLTSIFEEACHLNPDAQHSIGNLCEHSGEVALAESWYLLAAAQGYDPSRHRLTEICPPRCLNMA
jgi:hypothetical protein